MKKSALSLIVLAGVVGYFVWIELSATTASDEAYISRAPLEPNWSSIASWPASESARAQATPDPGRRYTAIILDDSGSMGDQMEPAKRAVEQALSAMQSGDRVAVIGLNAGIILDFTQVDGAQSALAALRPVRADGPTPLTRAVRLARAGLEEEASEARGFGIYQMIITTDGAADDGVALTAAIEDLARNTPIQIATIGIAIGDRHVLRRDDVGRFVDVSNIAGLQDALQAAVAENASFEAITDFAGSD